MLPDGWVRYGLSPARAMPDSPNWDADNDGLDFSTNRRTSPLNTDTDEDGVNDGTEVAQGPPSDALDNGDPATA